MGYDQAEYDKRLAYLLTNARRTFGLSQFNSILA